MRKQTILGILALMTAGACLAQTAEKVRFYKVDFGLKEVEAGKVVSSRTYSMIVHEGLHNISNIRTGSKVPLQAGNGAFNYLDVGVNIDCSDVKEVDGELAMDINADVSSIPADSAAPLQSAGVVVRQNKWRSGVVVPLHKSTVIFSSDDLTSKRVMQMEVTATALK